MKRVFAVLFVLCLIGTQFQAVKADTVPTVWHFDDVEWTISEDASSAIARARFYGFAGGQKVYAWQPMQIISQTKDRFGRTVFTAYLSAGRSLDHIEHIAEKTAFPRPIPLDKDKIIDPTPRTRELGGLAARP